MGNFLCLVSHSPCPKTPLALGLIVVTFAGVLAILDRCSRAKIEAAQRVRAKHVVQQSPTRP